MNAIDSACQDAAAMGITVLAASGDNGASDGSDSGQLDVDFPSSSPHIVGCGGTKLTISAEKVSQEVVWNELSQQEGATGGGVSQTFALPDWQASANVPKSPSGKAGRGVPDVAGDADPATGYEVFVDGAGAVIGGTSAVAPLWAGLLALFNQSLKKPVGFINPLLYASPVSSSFRDITSGNNDGYNAGKGWDACTGLGSPDGAKLLAALSSSPSASGGKSPTKPGGSKGSGKKLKPTKKKSKKKR
jgi:kumamolisin